MQKDCFARVIAIAGTVLAGVPILASVVFLGIGLIGGRAPGFDWLIPAELFPVVIVSGGLEIWAALRAHSRIRFVAWTFGLAVVSLVGGQLPAIASGLASGQTEPAGPAWVAVTGSIVLYSLCVAAMCIGGFLLVRDLLRPDRKPADQAHSRGTGPNLT